MSSGTHFHPVGDTDFISFSCFQVVADSAPRSGGDETHWREGAFFPPSPSEIETEVAVPF
jgi:hypothetical protein